MNPQQRWDVTDLLFLIDGITLSHAIRVIKFNKILVNL